MKVLLINGSPHEHGCTATALQEVAKTLAKHNIDTEIQWLGVKGVHDCMACGRCRETGRCVFDDEVNRVLEQADQIDGLVVGSPVYYGGPAGQVISFLDRLFYASKGRLAKKPAACVVSCRRGGATAAFERLNQYFAMNNMPIATSQYWNQIHGNTREEALQDLEGLQTMRTLGENMAWLLACIQAGRKDQVPEPFYEHHQATNFIR